MVSAGVALTKDGSVTGLRSHADCLHLADQECSSMGVMSLLWVHPRQLSWSAPPTRLLRTRQYAMCGVAYAAYLLCCFDRSTRMWSNA